MAACPNCRSHIFDGQLFCRACGFCLESNFQISTQSLGLPAAERATVPAQPMPRFESPRNAHHRLALPLAGFLLALLVGGLSVASIGNEFAGHHFLTGSNSFLFAERSYIGVYLMDSDDCSGGAVIDEVVVGSPAEQAGLVNGDRIIAINDVDVGSSLDFVSRLKRIAPGTTVTLKVARDQEQFFIPVTTVRRSELQMQSRRPQGFLGVGDLESVPTYTGSLGESKIDQGHGVRIGKVVEGSAAEQAGLQAGDVILAIDDHVAETPLGLSRLVRAKAPQQSVSILLLRDGQPIQLTAILGERE